MLHLGEVKCQLMVEQRVSPGFPWGYPVQQCPGRRGTGVDLYFLQVAPWFQVDSPQMA